MKKSGEQDVHNAASRGRPFHCTGTASNLTFGGVGRDAGCSTRLGVLGDGVRTGLGESGSGESVGWGILTCVTMVGNVADDVGDDE